MKSDKNAKQSAASTHADPYPRKAIPCKTSKDIDQAGRDYANLITSPEFATYRVIHTVESKNVASDIDAPGLLAVLRDQAQTVNRNDLSQLEGMLTNQATALQSIFSNLTEKAFNQEFLPNFEMIMKLAFKAQSQCRATIETLSAIKNPPVVIAKQANIANGPQQVNNSAITNLPARENSNLPNELLKDSNETMDSRGTITTSPTDQKLATME